MSNSLWPHGLQHARHPCPSLTPRVYSNSCPLSRWCHPTISPSVIPFSSHLPTFPASGSFTMSQFFASGGQSTGASASASVLPMNIQDWFPLEFLPNPGSDKTKGMVVLVLTSQSIEGKNGPQEHSGNMNYERYSLQDKNQEYCSCLLSRDYPVHSLQPSFRLMGWLLQDHMSIFGEIQWRTGITEGERKHSSPSWILLSGWK